MSTRGVYGFFSGGRNKILYNHQDSYPDNLGRKIFGFVRDHTDKELKNLCDSIKVIEDMNGPPPTDAGDPVYWELGVPNEGLLFIENSEIFLGDSLNCEWAYVINLDAGVLEIYKGRQKEVQENRYQIFTSGSAIHMGYEACALQNTFRLENIRLLKNEDISIILEQVRTEKQVVE